MKNVKCLYGNNTTADTRECGLHDAVISATKNKGVFSEPFSDVFTLRKTPENSACEWMLEWIK